MKLTTSFALIVEEPVYHEIPVTCLTDAVTLMGRLNGSVDKGPKDWVLVATIRETHFGTSITKTFKTFTAKGRTFKERAENVRDIVQIAAWKMLKKTCDEQGMDFKNTAWRCVEIENQYGVGYSYDAMATHMINSL